MRISVFAVGRMKPGPERSLIDDYLARLNGIGPKVGITRTTISEVAESRSATVVGRQSTEAIALWALVGPRAFTILLDKSGKILGSEAFAKLVQREIDHGVANLVFLIGGPDGHASESQKRADFVLSLGAMTWPHRLARVMLIEQIYRSVTIMVDHPYHRL